MTVSDCIQIVDSYEPNAYDLENKCRWVRECEGKVYSEIFLQQPIGFHAGPLAMILGYELAIPAPYNKIYPRYLQAMIHYANGEYDRYANSMQMFNDAWADLNIWFGQDYDITDRARNRRVTVRIAPMEADDENPAANYQTLMTVPERCALVAGRIVIKKPFRPADAAPDETVTNYGKVWFGNPKDYVSAQKIDFASPGSSGVKMLIGDVGGTDLGIKLTEPADGEGYFTAVLCQPEEEFYQWPQMWTVGRPASPLPGPEDD
jgi:hypothetical protein